MHVTKAALEHAAVAEPVGGREAIRSLGDLDADGRRVRCREPSTRAKLQRDLPDLCCRVGLRKAVAHVAAGRSQSGARLREVAAEGRLLGQRAAPGALLARGEQRQLVQRAQGHPKGEGSMDQRAERRRLEPIERPTPEGNRVGKRVREAGLELLRLDAEVHARGRAEPHHVPVPVMVPSLDRHVDDDAGGLALGIEDRRPVTLDEVPAVKPSGLSGAAAERVLRVRELPHAVAQLRLAARRRRAGTHVPGTATEDRLDRLVREVRPRQGRRRRRRQRHPAGRAVGVGELAQDVDHRMRMSLSATEAAGHHHAEHARLDEGLDDAIVEYPALLHLCGLRLDHGAKRTNLLERHRPGDLHRGLHLGIHQPSTSLSPGPLAPVADRSYALRRDRVNQIVQYSAIICRYIKRIW